jgi:hypothetical protein
MLFRLTFALTRISRKQASRDLDPRGFRLFLANQATLAVALNLAELIAIDLGIERGALPLSHPRVIERTKQEEQHDRRETAENEPKQQERGPPPNQSMIPKSCRLFGQDHASKTRT